MRVIFTNPVSIFWAISLEIGSTAQATRSRNGLKYFVLFARAAKTIAAAGIKRMAVRATTNARFSLSSGEVKEGISFPLLFKNSSDFFEYLL